MVCLLPLQRCHLSDDYAHAAWRRQCRYAFILSRTSSQCKLPHRMSQLLSVPQVPGASYFSGSSMSCNVSWERSHNPSPRDPLSRSFAMRRAIRALAALGLLAGAAVTALAVAGPAAADTQICDQYGSTTIGGRYVVMNNRWGTSAQQCINVTGTGFSITSQQGTGSTSGAPVSYPAVYLGCHHTHRS